MVRLVALGPHRSRVVAEIVPGTSQGGQLRELRSSRRRTVAGFVHRLVPRPVARTAIPGASTEQGPVSTRNLGARARVLSPALCHWPGTRARPGATLAGVPVQGRAERPPGTHHAKARSRSFSTGNKVGTDERRGARRGDHDGAPRGAFRAGRRGR